MEVQLSKSETELQGDLHGDSDINLGYQNLDLNFLYFQDSDDVVDWYTEETSFWLTHPCNIELFQGIKALKFHRLAVFIVNVRLWQYLLCLSKNIEKTSWSLTNLTNCQNASELLIWSVIHISPAHSNLQKKNLSELNILDVIK